MRPDGMVQHDYPLVVGGYRWNLLQRCLHEVGIEPAGSGDFFDSDMVGTTYLLFDRVLTAREKDSLDTLMKDNPSFPPGKSADVVLIKDIYEWLDDFNAATGLNARLYYNDGGRGKVDIIELHFAKVLDLTEKTKIRLEYTNLMDTGL